MNLYKEYINKLETAFKKETVINPKLDAKLSRDLRKDAKSLTAFVNKSYQKIMNLCSNKEKLKDFFISSFDKMSISQETIDKFIFNIDKINDKKSLQKYLTNILLKGSGNAVRESVINEALKPIDKKVVDYFYKRKPLTGKVLTTDGDILEKIGLGGQPIAKWKGGKLFIVAVMDSKSTASTLRYMKKTFPHKRFAQQTPISDFI